MMRRMKLIILIMILLMAFSVNATAAQSGNLDALKLQNLQNKFPDGKYWDHLNEGSSTTMSEKYQNTVTDYPCSHNTYNVNGYDCNHFDGGGQCDGFARKFFYEYFGVKASKRPCEKDKKSLNNLKPGDIVRYHPGKSDHSIWITGISGETVTYADANISGPCRISWNKTTTLSDIRKSFIKIIESPEVNISEKETEKTSDIKLSKTPLVLYKGQTQKLQIVGTASKNVKWTSSNKRVVTVKNGTVTAKKAGTDIVTAQIGKIRKTCKITVKNPTISLKPKSKTIKVGDRIQLETVVHGKNKNVTWKSTKNAIANVNSKGVVKAKKSGRVTITAKANGVIAKCKITVIRKSKSKANYDKMYTEYKKIILSSIDKYGRYNSFALYDADGDKIPELYISNVRGSTEYAVYSFTGNKIKKIGKVSEGVWFYANPDGNGIVNSSMDAIGVYKVNSNSVVRIAYYEWNYTSQENSRWNAAAKKYFTQKAFIPTSGSDFGEMRTSEECIKRYDKLIKPYMK